MASTPEPRYVDLHAHSTASDGSVAPGDLPRLAREAGLAGLALTDHDTTAGVHACAAAAAREGLAFLAGIEISADPGECSGTIHVLGYGIDPDRPGMRDLTRRLVAIRDTRNPRIVERLNAMGMNITMVDVAQRAGSSVIGRPHIARALFDKGYVASLDEAFARYIGRGKPAYVRQQRLATDEAIAAIHAAGGLACLAHPVQLKCTDDAMLAGVVERLVGEGLDAIEVDHPDHTAAQREAYRALAERHGLLVSGGSDFHGDVKPQPLGCQRVDESVMLAMLERLGRA